MSQNHLNTESGSPIAGLFTTALSTQSNRDAISKPTKLPQPTKLPSSTSLSRPTTLPASFTWASSSSSHCLLDSIYQETLTPSVLTRPKHEHEHNRRRSTNCERPHPCTMPILPLGRQSLDLNSALPREQQHLLDEPSIRYVQDDILHHPKPKTGKLPLILAASLQGEIQEPPRHSLSPSSSPPQPNLPLCISQVDTNPSWLHFQAPLVEFFHLDLLLPDASRESSPMDDTADMWEGSQTSSTSSRSYGDGLSHIHGDFFSP